MADDDLPPRRLKPRKLPSLDQENPDTDEVNTDPPRRKKRQKPPQAPPADDVPPGNPPPNVGSTENLMSPNHEPGGGLAAPKKKKKKRPRPSPEGEEGPALGVAAHLDNSLEVEQVAGHPMTRFYGSSRRITPVKEEDRVDSATPPVPGVKDTSAKPYTGDDVVVERTSKFIDEPALNSQPADLFFTEHKSGFRKETLQQYRHRVQQESMRDSMYQEHQDVPNLTRQFAIRFQRAFRILCTFLHGVFSGFAIAHTLFVFMLPCAVFLTYYGSYLEPLAITYYIVIVFLCVSACDRYDIGKPTRLCCEKVMTCKIPGFVVLLYAAAFIINNAMFNQKITLATYSTNLTVYSTKAEFCTTITVWRALDATRTALLVLGWLVLTFSPIYDRLEEDLAIDMVEELHREEEGNEMLNVKH